MILLLFLGLVVGDHFQFGIVEWSRVDASTREVTFKIVLGFEEAHYARRTVGEFVDVDLRQSYVFQYGDGTDQTLTASSEKCQLTRKDASAAEVQCLLAHEYSADGSYTAFFVAEARTSTLLNNAFLPFRIGSVVNLQLGLPNNSPVAAVFPMQFVLVYGTETMATVPLIFVDPEAGPTNFTFSTEAQFGSVGSTPPPGMFIDDGILKWNVQGIADGLYSNSLQVFDDVGNQITVDWILRLSRVPSTFSPATFVVPTPAVREVLVGYNDNTVFDFTVRAEHPDTSIQLVVASTAPPVGMQVASTQDSGNVVSLKYEWGPSPSQLGSFPLCFTATFEHSGLTIVSPPHCFSIIVYVPCPRHCTSPVAGTCHGNLYTPGTCECNTGYCLEDCRAHWPDQPGVVENCAPSTCAISVTPNTRHAVPAEVTVACALPQTTMGNELWVRLPEGWRGSQRCTSEVQWIKGLDVSMCTYHVDGMELQIRCPDEHNLVPSSPIVSFTWTCVRVPNRCNEDDSWRISTHRCSNANLWNQSVVFRRRCEPYANTNQQYDITWRHGMQCDLCNACRYFMTDHLAVRWYECEHPEGWLYTRKEADFESSCHIDHLGQFVAPNYCVP